ncbi:MAG: hypothetical protein HKN18_14720 [Silicimonas sp.]|nr:hypothetical protein [Silicimonas sp.]
MMIKLMKTAAAGTAVIALTGCSLPYYEPAEPEVVAPQPVVAPTATVAAPTATAPAYVAPPKYEKDDNDSDEDGGWG